MAGRFRINRRRFAILGGCLVSALCVPAYVALRTPGWYSPPTIEPAERQQVRNDLVQAEQAFTEQLLFGNGPFVYHLREDDVNRWLTMREEIYPGLSEWNLPGLSQPYIRFNSGRITLAGRYETWPASVLLSIDITPAFRDGHIVLQASGANCGSMPVSLSFGGVDLGRHLDRPAESVWPGSPRMAGDLISGFEIEARAWWKNGGAAYRVQDVWIEPGVLNLRIEPLGPRQTTARSDQLRRF